MKWLFVLLLALFIVGAAWFGYNLVFKQDIQVRQEQRGEITAAPTPDISLPEFQAAAKLRQEGKLVEARNALTIFLQKYPGGAHSDEAKDVLGEVNTDILLSSHPSPEKEEYIVKPGDVLAKVGRKVKSTPELIMRMNNLNGTMLRIGQRLLISHPDFSVLIQRKARVVVLLNNGAFFKQYHVREEKLPSKSTKVITKVAETLAWKDGKRVGFGTKEFAESTRWIRLGNPSYTIFSVADAAHSKVEEAPPQGIGLDAADVEELSSLVNNKTPVTITD
jgi:LysM repeat protein